MTPPSRTRAAAAAQMRRRLDRLTPGPALLPAGASAGWADSAADDLHRHPDPDRHPDQPQEWPAGPPGDQERRPVPGAGARRSVRVDPGRPGLLLLCGVALVVAVLTALVTTAGRTDSTPVPVTAATAPDALPPSDGVTAPTEGATTAATTADPGTVVVAVVGQVVTPGLVTLPGGSRVADAITAAGGALPEADLSTVNLARVLLDGEQVAVGVPGAPPAPGSAGGGPGEPGPIDLNTATEGELEELPGVGPVLAARIVTYREDNGGFTSVEELQDVSGIGPSTFAELQDAVTV